MHFRPWIPDSVFFVQECIDADRVSDLPSTVFCYFFVDLKKWDVSNPFTKHPTDVVTTFAQQILRFCVGWLQEISCGNALVCGTSMSLLGAEQYFAGCLWIDCCGCHSAPIVLNTDFAPWKCVWIFVFSPFQAVKHVFFFVCFLHFMHHHFNILMILLMFFFLLISRNLSFDLNYCLFWTYLQFPYLSNHSIRASFCRQKKRCFSWTT